MVLDAVVGLTAPYAVPLILVVDATSQALGAINKPCVELPLAGPGRRSGRRQEQLRLTLKVIVSEVLEMPPDDHKVDAFLHASAVVELRGGHPLPGTDMILDGFKHLTAPVRVLEAPAAQ